MAAGEAQRATMSLNDLGSRIIESEIRQFVLFGKANVSHDCGRQFGLNLRMETAPAATDYRDHYCARTRLARIAAGYSQEQMATQLGMEQSKYTKYEGRSLLPQRYIEIFCLATRIEERWLITGKGRGPATLTNPAPKPPRRPRRQPKAA
jgi:DNA-binding XRE family transcriptional regulator